MIEKFQVHGFRFAFGELGYASVQVQGSRFNAKINAKY